MRLHLGRYYFNKSAISKGNKILSSENISCKQIIVIDEIGPLEFSGQGWSNAIDNITRSSTLPQLWVMRKSIVKKVTKRWNTGNIYIFDIKESTISEVEKKIIEIISQQTNFQFSPQSSEIPDIH